MLILFYLLDGLQEMFWSQTERNWRDLRCNWRFKQSRSSLRFGKKFEDSIGGWKEARELKVLFQEKKEFKEAGRPHKLGRRPPTYFVVSNLEFEIELERKCKELGFEGFIQEWDFNLRTRLILNFLSPF